MPSVLSQPSPSARTSSPTIGSVATVGTVPRAAEVPGATARAPAVSALVAAPGRQASSERTRPANGTVLRRMGTAKGPGGLTMTNRFHEDALVTLYDRSVSH